MAHARTVPARLLTAAVWGSGALLAVIPGQIMTGWGSDRETRALNDLAYVPVTVLTAVLGLWLALRGRLDQRERGAWILLELAFVCQGAARVASLDQDFRPGPPSSPAVSDYLYLAAIPFV